MINPGWSSKNELKALYLLLILLGLLGIVSCTTRVDVFEIISQEPNIRISYEEYEIQNKTGVFSFGQLEISQRKNQTFNISNTGELTLTIKGISFVGDYDQFYVDDSSMETILESGSSTTITVSFIPTRSGTFTMKLVLESDDPDDEIFTFNLTGVGIESSQTSSKPELEVYYNITKLNNRTQLHLGKLFIGTSEIVELLIKNEGETSLYINDINYSGNLSQFSREEPDIPTILAKDEYTTLRIIFHPDSTGTYELEVSFVTNDPDENDFTVTITGEGNATPEPDIKISTGNMEILPGITSYDFGYVQKTMESEPVSFKIENTGNEDLKIYSINTTGTDNTDFILDTQNVQETISPGDSTLFYIIFKPSTEGEKIASVIISTNDPDNQEQTFIFEIKGMGTTEVVPNIQVSVDSVKITSGSIGYDFGVVTIGESTPSVTFTIQNTGTEPLGVSDMTKSGADSENFILDSTSIPAYLSPLSTIFFTVTYNPSYKGKHSVEISIESNDPDTDPFTFIINGEASEKDTPNMQIYLNGQPYYDGSSYYFGEITPSESSDPVTFTIVNEGSAELRINTYKKRGGEIKDFEVNFPNTPLTIPQGGQEYFTVTFSPSNSDSKSTRLEILSNSGKYNILLEGIGQ